MTIDLETFERLIEISRDSVRQEFHQIPGDRSGAAYWQNRDGSLTKMVADPARINHSFRFIDTLREFVDTVTFEGGPDAIFVSPTKVIYLFDRNDGRDKSVCPLDQTKVFELLSKVSGRMYNQKQFINAIRVEFAGTLPNQPELLLAVRSLKFRAESESDGNVNHGSESIGKSIRRSLAGAEQIPESVIFTVNVFEGVEYPIGITCALDIDLEEGMIRLSPVGNDLRWAVDSTLVHIASKIGDGLSVPVYIGEP